MLGTGDDSSVKAMGLSLHKITMREFVQAFVSKNNLDVVAAPKTRFFLRGEKDPETKQFCNSALLSVCDSRVIRTAFFLQIPIDNFMRWSQHSFARRRPEAYSSLSSRPRLRIGLPFQLGPWPLLPKRLSRMSAIL